MKQETEKFRTWFYSFLVMIALAAASIVGRVLGFTVLNLAFEICIFYLPVIILLIILLVMRNKERSQQY